MNRLVPFVFIGLFFAVSLVFMVAPTLMLAVQSVEGEHGLTFAYLHELLEYRYVIAFKNSIILSVTSALAGVVIGGLVAHAVLKQGAPSWLRSLTTSFSAVAANFAGVPLAFAFISTLGTLGLLTTALKNIGFDIYDLGFSLYSLGGLALVYSYFQIPLMVIIISPAIQALRGEWRETSENLGATSRQYWWLVGFPVLVPSLLSAFILLFGNAFSAYATAYALTSGNIGLLPTEIGNVLSGNVSSSPQTGAALSVAMIGVMLVVLILNAVLSRRSARWTVRDRA